MTTTALGFLMTTSGDELAYRSQQVKCFVKAIHMED
jgi:hypothetical protein